MKKKISTHLIAVMLFAVMIPATALAGGIQWQSFDKGMAMAKEQGKNVVLYFHADWCGYCKKMEKTTFKKASVIDYINKNFIAITVDSDKEKKIAKDYGVRGLPTMWFVKPDSSKIGNRAGYLEEETLVTILKFIKTESYKTMSYNDFKKAL